MQHVKKYFVGVDPGEGGGWAAVNYLGQLVRFGAGQGMHRDFVSWINQEGLERISGVYIEAQGARRGDTQHGIWFNIQKLLVNYGLWIGICEALGLIHTEVHPLKWMQRYKCAGRMHPKERKKAYLAVARMLFPEKKWLEGDHDLAAAALLALMARDDFVLEERRS